MTRNKPNLDAYWLVLIFGAIFIYVLLENAGIVDWIPGLGNQSITVNVDTDGDGLVDSQIIQEAGSVDLCSAFRDNYPLYIETKRLQCMSFGADWICTPDSIGCYNIPSWDSTQCNTDPEIQLIKAGCASLGAQWHCHSVSLGCEN